MSKQTTTTSDDDGCMGCLIFILLAPLVILAWVYSIKYLAHLIFS